MNQHSSHRRRLAAATAGMASVCVVGSVSAVELSLQADATDALIINDAPTTITVTLEAGEGGAGDYELHQQFVDRYGQGTDGPTIQVQLSDRWQHQVEVPVEHYGPTTYHARLTRAGEEKPVAEAEQMLIRPVPQPRLSDEERARSSMGINVHVDARWESLAAMGVHWARDYSWGWLGDGSHWPRAENGTNFSNVRADADAAGITILPVMQRAFRTEDNKYFITDGDAIAAGYERLSNAEPEFVYWELDNEAELEHRDITSEGYQRWFDTYVDYIRYADKGLQAAGHGAQVVLNGEAGIHADRAKLLLDKVGDHFSVINYHYYCGTVAPELARNDINTGSEDRPRTTSFLDQLLEINRIAHEHGKEAWLTEIGWSARSGPAVGDRLQSAYLGRLYLLARWAGTDKTFWFWDRDLRPGGRFSSSEFIEFIHGDSGARPVGAAMAAVSRFTATAEYAGSVDLGDDRWCLIFRESDGGYLAAAWAVESEHDLPSPLAGAAEAFGMYGNPLRDARLTAEPAYFRLAELPADWEAQLTVEWLTPRIINVYQGDGSEVEVAAPEGVELTWEGKPDGAQSGTWRGAEGQQATTLTATPQLAVGTYEFNAVVRGEGWEKRFPLTLKVRPAVDVEPTPHTAGAPTEIRFTNLLSEATEATLRVEQGTVEPTTVSLDADGRATATFTAPEGAAEPIALHVELSNGATQKHWIRQGQLHVPRVDQITIDGDLSDWPEAGELLDRALKVDGPEEDFAPRMKLAWSEEGLYMAAVIPVGDDFTPAAEPQSFWEWTSVELSFNAADARGPYEDRSHLLWFTPTRDGDDQPWRVYAGEWRKTMPDGSQETINDDDRPTTAMQYDGQTVTMEVLIPNEVLGAAPQAGHEWPLTIHAKVAKALSPRTLAIWPAGTGSGREAWGRVIFVE